MCSPLVATQFAQLRHWSFHFLCSLGIALVNNVILLIVFRGKTQDGEITALYNRKLYLIKLSECLKEIGQEAGEQGTSDQSKYRQILGQKVVHLLAIFSLIYVGTEVTIGGTQQIKEPFDYFITYLPDRLDGHVYNRQKKRRRVIRLHLYRILWRFASSQSVSPAVLISLIRTHAW